MPFRDEQHEKLEEYLELLQKRERKEFLELMNSWELISGSLEEKIEKLSKLKNLSEDQLYRLELYKTFLEDSRVVVNTYSNIANGVIVSEQEEFAKLGLKSAQELIGVNFNNKLNIDAVKYMIGNTSEGTPLLELLRESYPETVERITKTLVESMSLGRSPVETASLLKQDMDGNLNRALRIARTEQMNVFKESQTQQYIKSGIVKSKNWDAESDACEICLEGESNSPYDLDEVMQSHPNCRCSWIPVL